MHGISNYTWKVFFIMAGSRRGELGAFRFSCTNPAQVDGLVTGTRVGVGVHMVPLHHQSPLSIKSISNASAYSSKKEGKCSEKTENFHPSIC